MTRRIVEMTEAAERDLEELHHYVAEHDSPHRAEDLLDRVLGLAADLAELPERGSPPKELAGLGIHEYRQVLMGPYRVIYRVVDGRAVVYLIADGRRDMQTLLAKRLLGG